MRPLYACVSQTLLASTTQTAAFDLGTD